MGEYAIRKSDGANIKIGTCESMYYLRADQRHLVQGTQGNVDPNSKDALSIRFRFPWPDEDGTLPGEFEDYGRAVTVYGVPAPQDVEHENVQFAAQAGYLVSLPCPEGPSTHGLKIARNGFAGAVQLTQQKLLADGRLVPVCRCGGCGTAWRMEDPAEIEALAVAFRAEGDKRRKDSWTDSGEHVGHVFWHAIADRILQGAKLAHDGRDRSE